MSEDRGRRADELFEAALDIDPEARAAWLAAEAGEDPELRREVEELLAAHEIAGGILEAGLRVHGAELPPADRAEGRRIGSYRVLRELGRGGMGVVYLAERDDGQFRRRVAVKLLRASPDGEELRRRFLAERQILASLAHPHIAQLLDGGVTDGQLPYLVMEYVEGLPLTEYCDRHRLRIPERLALFRAVCEAVHHAHRNLVLHRDLKPSNILVTEAGLVKLLDFGIAKLLNPELSAIEAPVTRTELRVMTPEYASPEQVRGEPLSTASDVYALGVVLYELLTGRRPYELTTGSPGELARVVCRLEPERPSAATAPPAVSESVGEARGASVEALRKALRGDLDAIAMMALRKEPGGRYGSADLLATDIQRHLDGLPVLAHRGSRRYRARKFLRRNRLQVAMLVLVGLSLLSGAAAALWQASMARAERDRARAAHAETEQALAQSEEVAGFLVDLFRASDPEETLGDEITARQLLERGEERADRLAGQPLVQARMLEVIGRVHRHLGEYEPARPLVLQSLAIREAHAGPDSLDIVSSLAELGELELAAAEYEAAESRFRRALDLLRRVPEPEAEAVARSLMGLGKARERLGDYAGAEAFFREALDLQRAEWGPEHPEIARTWSELALSLHNQGEYDAAEALLRSTLELRERLFGEDHPEIAQSLIQLAGVYAARDERYDRSEALHRRALEIRQRVYGEEHPAVANSLGYVAGTLSFQGKYAEAEPLLRQALDLNRRILGPRHTDVGAATNSLALLLLRTGRVDEADRRFREAVSIYEETLGRDHHYVASVIGNLARVALARGDLDGAEVQFRDALDRRIRTLGPNHPFTSASQLSLGDVLERKGAYPDAEALYRQALEAYERRADAAGEARRVHRELSELYDAWGRPEEALHHQALASAPEAR